MESQERPAKQDEPVQAPSSPVSAKPSFLSSFFKRAAVTGQLAAKEALRRKIQSMDLRKADQEIGRKAFEDDLVPPEFGETVSKLKQFREQMAELRQPEKAASESIGDKARAAASATAKKAKIEAIKLKEANLLGDLGAKIRAQPDKPEALKAEIEVADKATGRIEAIDTEIEALRSESWVKRPLLILVVAGVLVALFFGVRGFRHRDNKYSLTNSSIAAETERYERDQREAQAEAERNRQAQLDSIRQITEMTEKSQRQYQEKQKKEEEESQKAERDKAAAESNEKAEVAHQETGRREAAEASQKALEENFLKNRPKVTVSAEASGTPPLSGSPQITINSIPLGPAPKTQSEMESRVGMTEDGSRILVVASQGSREQAIVDGQPGPVCRRVRWATRDRTDSEPKNSVLPPFSSDNERVAYVMEMDGERESVVIDSVQSPTYAKILWLGFGPTGHHAAFEASEKDQAGGKPHEYEHFVSIIDEGKAGPPYDRIGDVVFSADGQHLAYIGQTEPYKGLLYGRKDFGRSEYALVVDGQEQGKHYNWATQLVMSRDGKHYGFLVGEDSLGTQKVVIDGQETPRYAFTQQLTMSDDGSRTAFVTWVNPKRTNCSPDRQWTAWPGIWIHWGYRHQSTRGTTGLRCSAKGGQPLRAIRSG